MGAVSPERAGLASAVTNTARFGRLAGNPENTQRFLFGPHTAAWLATGQFTLGIVVTLALVERHGETAYAH